MLNFKLIRFFEDKIMCKGVCLDSFLWLFAINTDSYRDHRYLIRHGI